jgi:hypothetical protein
MSRAIHREILSGTASSGAFSVNTQESIRGILREVIASPATSSTVYTITITNPSSRTIYKRTSQTGDLAEELAIPIRGVNTISITGSTADELFNLELVVEQ